MFSQRQTHTITHTHAHTNTHTMYIQTHTRTHKILTQKYTHTYIFTQTITQTRSWWNNMSSSIYLLLRLPLFPDRRETIYEDKIYQFPPPSPPPGKPPATPPRGISPPPHIWTSRVPTKTGRKIFFVCFKHTKKNRKNIIQSLLFISGMLPYL